MAKRTIRRPRKHSSIKNFLVPHEGNGYHPHVFRRTAVVTLVLAVVFVEGAYLFDTQVAQNKEGFMASVLPGALFSLTNADRSANGVAPLTEDPKLDEAAQLKANDMASKGYFAHVSPDGKTPWYWLGQVGYQYTYAGENLAINFDDSSAVEAAWMNSPTHRANIVKPQYTRVGYAVAEGMYQGKETTFVVQEFAAQPTDETVTAEPKQQNIVASAVQKVVAVAAPARMEQPEKVAVAGKAAQAPIVEGAETHQSQAAAPVSTGQPMVLATNHPQAATDATSESILKQVAASPLAASIYILGGLIILMLALLLLALLTHKNARTLEVLGGGVIVVVFALSVLAYNATHTPSPVLPDAAAATVASGP